MLMPPPFYLLPPLSALKSESDVAEHKFPSLFEMPSMLQQRLFESAQIGPTPTASGNPNLLSYDIDNDDQDIMMAEEGEDELMGYDSSTENDDNSGCFLAVSSSYTQTLFFVAKNDPSLFTGYPEQRQRSLLQMQKREVSDEDIGNNDSIRRGHGNFSPTNSSRKKKTRVSA